MSVVGVRVFRLVLLLYPAEFRRRYGDDMVQLMIDQQRHDRRPVSLVLMDEAIDAARTAPRMRWESPMKIGFLEGSRVQQLHADARFDHMDMCGGEPTAWWRIECSHCHTDFVTWNTRRRHCSEDCRIEAKRALKRARQAARAAGGSTAEVVTSSPDEHSESVDA